MLTHFSISASFLSLFFFSFRFYHVQMFLQIYKEVISNQSSLILREDIKENQNAALKHLFSSLDLKVLHRTGQVSPSLFSKKDTRAPCTACQRSWAQTPTCSPHRPREGYVQQTATAMTRNRLINKDSLFALPSDLFFITQSTIPNSGFVAKCSKRPHNWFRHRKDIVKLGFLLCPLGREDGFSEAMRYQAFSHPPQLQLDAFLSILLVGSTVVFPGKVASYSNN